MSDAFAELRVNEGVDKIKEQVLTPPFPHLPFSFFFLPVKVLLPQLAHRSKSTFAQKHTLAGNLKSEWNIRLQRHAAVEGPKAIISRFLHSSAQHTAILCSPFHRSCIQCGPRINHFPGTKWQNAFAANQSCAHTTKHGSDISLKDL